MVEKSARMMVPLNGTMEKTFSQFHPKKTKVKKIQIKKTSPRGWIQRFFPFFSSICSCCCCILFKLLLRTKGRCPIPSSSSTSSAYKISRILSLSLLSPFPVPSSSLRRVIPSRRSFTAVTVCFLFVFGIEWKYWLSLSRNFRVWVSGNLYLAIVRIVFW